MQIFLYFILDLVLFRRLIKLNLIPNPVKVTASRDNVALAREAYKNAPLSFANTNVYWRQYSKINLYRKVFRGYCRVLQTGRN